ncbi:uncharacterized protein LOC133709301 isoform X2 [Rosa rugosa]|uniref:uncharacterized protein LOC133709301 isoform X2 n=1 Tax=Rosa rugosa TaxID=74645 RepID=UPI002B40F5B3|nr:uncharacterized protein LOC133709301 isoform X2 [Rosa rugosa]
MYNQMVKKRVPEWLNSSLWSSPPSAPPIDDDRTQRYTSKPSTATTTGSDSVVEPPLPVPPPSSVRAEPPPEPQSADSISDHEDKSASAPSPEEFSRQSQLLAELSKKTINVRELRKIASQGIPDGAGVRSTVWKLLLGYLPPDRALWPSELAKKRSQYKHFKDELLMNPSEITRKLEDNGTSCDSEESKSKGLLSRSHIAHGEHPLSLGKSSIWNQFFQDTEIIEQIDRDVKRTHPDMHFFSGDSQFAKSNQDALKNILVVFAKLNPGIRYVQGMNELLAPLYYIFKNDPDEEYAVNPQFYAFRWITLLLTQEFNFADSLHIWDTLLSDSEGPQETLLRVCCAMLILVRRRLLAGDFTSNLKLLQHYPPTNISHLLYVANKLRVQSSG